MLNKELFYHIKNVFTTQMSVFCRFSFEIYYIMLYLCDFSSWYFDWMEKTGEKLESTIRYTIRNEVLV